MKKTIISICTAIALGTAVSCTDNFEDININPHCCPEKFYHSVSCLGPLPSGTLAVRSV